MYSSKQTKDDKKKIFFNSKLCYDKNEITTSYFKFKILSNLSKYRKISGF